METAGNFVAAAAKFTACMEHRQHHRLGGDAQLFIDTHRNAAAVIPYGDHITRQNFHFNMGAEARQRFIDGVVHNFIYQMVQAFWSSGANVHTRTLPDSLQPLQYLDLAFVIGLVFRPHHAVFQFLFLQLFFCTHWIITLRRRIGALFLIACVLSIFLRYPILAIPSMNPVRLHKVVEDICDI